MTETEKAYQRELAEKVRAIIRNLLIFAALGVALQLLFAFGRATGDLAEACKAAWPWVLAKLGITTLYPICAPRGFFAVFSFSALNTMCALGVGGLVGFLFGIPKTERAAVAAAQPADAAAPPVPSPPGGERSATIYLVNTNLEQISDWLTKIIVGIGLVELRNVPGYLHGYGEWAATAMGTSSAGSGAVVAATVLIAYLALGILAGYLITRMYVAPLLPQIDGAESEKRKTLRDIGVKPDTGLASFVPDPSARERPPETQREMAVALPDAAKDAARAVSLESLGANAELLRNYARAQVNLRDYPEARRALQRAVAAQPNDAALHYDLAYSHWLLDEVPAAFSELEMARALALQQKRFEDWRNYSEQYANWKLYVEDQDAPRDALSVLDEIARQSGVQPSGASLVYRAAANGQLYRFAAADAPDRAAYRDAALAAVKAIVDTKDPALVAWVTRLWNPFFREADGSIKDTSENDLEVFFTDKAFQDLLGRSST